MLKDHALVPGFAPRCVRAERRPALDAAGGRVPGLFNAWLSWDNPRQLNAFTADALREMVLAVNAASNDRAVVCIVLTAAGDRAFCSGGNVREYADYYAGRPQEYLQYMRLFNDLVTGLLQCDKPVINRVNGLRLAGGQEIGMACDFSIAADTATFGQAGPKHGSAPVGGATDFLDLYVGFGPAMESLTLCRPWSAYTAYRLGLIRRAVPVCRRDGAFIPDPLVITDRWIDGSGRIVFGDFKDGPERIRAEEVRAECVVDLSPLDAAVESLATELLYTMPGCLLETLNGLRRRKLASWQSHGESSRAWLALNMLAEGRAGFRAFAEGSKDRREVDFIELRRRLAAGEAWTGEPARDVPPGGRAP